MFSKKLLAFASMLILALQGWAQFNPPNPQEPAITYKIELACDPENIAGLQGAGNYQDGSSAWISTYSWNGNYQFQYWELDGKVYSKSSSFLYMLSTKDVKFIAHYKYCPDDPADPNAVFMRRVYLKSDPENVATFNWSNGQKFEKGTRQYFCAYGQWGYKFLGWYEGDNLLSTSNELWYTIPDKDVTLVAHYKFDPTSPNDPSNYYSTSCEINVESSNEEKGTVSVEGVENGRAIYGNMVTVKANAADGSVFCGWYNNGELVSENPTYSFVASGLYKKYNLTALFLNNPHTITFVLNDEVYYSALVETGAEISVPDFIGKDGYTFSGWNGLTDVMPDCNLTVTGTMILSKIRISSPSVSIQGGESVRLSVYAGDTSKVVINDVTWSVDNQDIAKLVKDGIIVGKTKGSTLVKAVPGQNPELYATCIIEVLSTDNVVELPAVAFEFNYNARDYDADNHSVPNDYIANLSDYSLVLNGGNYSYSDNKVLSITGYTEGYIDRWGKSDAQSGSYFNRSGSDELTIICKMAPRFDNSSNKSDIVCNGSGSNINYSFRTGYRNSIYLASRYSYANRFMKYDSGQEQIFAVRVRNNTVLLQNLTTGQTTVLNQNVWGSQNGPMKLFYSDSSNYFVGDFYWIYLSKSSLTDSEMWDVIDHNEGVQKGASADGMLGDVNNSGSVNVTDITATSDYLFGFTPAVFKFKNADVNQSRSVNVADIAGIASIIYGGTPAKQARSVDRSNSEQFAEVMVNCDSLIVGQSTDMSVLVNSNMRISALEFELDLPYGAIVSDVRINSERCPNSTVRGGVVDGKYKLMLYSESNTPFAGSEGEVVSISISTDGSLAGSEKCIIGVSDIIMSETGDEIRVPGYDLAVPMFTPTGVKPAQFDGTSYRYYDLSGKEIDGNRTHTGVTIIKESNGSGSSRTYKVR